MSPIISGGSSASATAAVGSRSLVYKYTVAGSVKLAIDTGVDAAQTGSSDFTAATLLEIYVYARTDEVANVSNCGLQFDTDSGASYDFKTIQGLDAATSTVGSTADTRAQMIMPGASAAASVFGVAQYVIPNYLNTTANRAGTGTWGSPGQAGVSLAAAAAVFEWRNTGNAINRVKLLSATGGVNFAIGTMLAIFKS